MEAEILVTVPQPQELEPLLDALRAAGSRSRTVAAGRLGGELFDSLRMLFVIGGHGKAQHAVHTQHVIDQLPELQVVVCAGAAGALDAGLVPGDVVVGASTIEHDYTLRFVQRALPRWDADGQLLGELRLAADRTGGSFRTLFGAIASGDEDVVDRARAVELAKATGALCVAWEGAGAARAARFSGRRFVELRVITDGADHAASADFAANVRRAMPSLAALLLAWGQPQSGGSVIGKGTVG